MESVALIESKLCQLLTKLKSASADYISLYIKPSSFPNRIDELLIVSGYGMYVDEIKEAVNTKAVIQWTDEYNTGAVIYWQGSGNKYIVLPPFSVAEDAIFTGELDISLLCVILGEECIIGVVLVTWGTYSIGVFNRGNLVESKTGSGYIHKEHKKGGSSAKRFARRTEEQKKEFLRKVSNRIEERFRNYKLDYVFFGGNRLILKPLLKECRYLEMESQKISRRILNVRHADKKILNHSLREITKSQVFIFGTKLKDNSRCILGK